MKNYMTRVEWGIKIFFQRDLFCLVNSLVQTELILLRCAPVRVCLLLLKDLSTFKMCHQLIEPISVTW